MKIWSKIRDFFSPSRRLRRKLAQLRDRWKGQWYEGPEPPPRLVEEVVIFRLLYPDASQARWQAFVDSAVRNAYRDGFVRGFQWNERDWDGKPTEDAERIAELMAHDWSLADQTGPRYDLLLKGVNPDDPLSHLPPDQRRAFLEQMELIGASPYQARVDLTPYEETE